MTLPYLLGKLKKIGIGFGIIFMTLLIPITVSAQSTEIPAWVKGVANFWVDGNISDDEFGEAITFLIEQEIIKVDMPQQTNNDVLDRKISQLESENVKLRSENTNLKNQNSQLQIKLNNNQPSQTTVPKSMNIPDNFKLYDLLPSQNDLNSKWKVLKSTEYNKPTKNFYYENAGQTNYDKNVYTIKKYRMNVYLFSDESLANEKFKEKTIMLKKNIGWFGADGEYHVFEPEQLIMDSNDCTGIYKHTDYTQNFEHVYGYCVVGKYMIYQDITGYYPGIHDDFIDMMNIAKTKTASVT